MEATAKTLSVLLMSALTGGMVLAETRGQPYSEEYLVKHCPFIFVGKVLEVNEHAMPTRVKVMLSIKGNVPLTERKLLAKHPGRCVIFKEEFDKAKKGRVGVFFVGTDWSPAVLMKYKEIRGLSEKSDADEKPGEKDKPT